MGFNSGFKGLTLVCSSKFGGPRGLVTDNNTAADLHGSYPSGYMNVGEFFD